MSEWTDERKHDIGARIRASQALLQDALAETGRSGSMELTAQQCLLARTYIEQCLSKLDGWLSE